MGRALLGYEVMQGRQVKVTIELHGGRNAQWAICPDSLDAQSVVYSFGVGEDVTFDCSLIERCSVTVHAFDPTPRSIDWLRGQQLPEGFLFYPFGIAAFDGTATFIAPSDPSYVSFSLLPEGRLRRGTQEFEARVHRVGTIMDLLGHDRVDILKMDIEGAEYDVLEDLLKEGLNIQQLLVEFHHRFEYVDVERTREAIRQLNAHGYRIFHVSPSGEEYAFIRV